MRVSCYSLLLIIALLTGCRRESPPSAEVATLDLRDRLSIFPGRNGASLAGGSYSPHFDATRNGVRRDSILLMPPVAVRASLKGVPGRATLQGIATPVYNIGDGMRLDIVLIEGGTEKMVYSRYYDAGRRAEDRAWIPFAAPLDLPQGQDVSIELRLTPGLQGDLVADWLALGELRVVQRTS